MTGDRVLGSVLRSLRQAAGMSQADLAVASGVYKPALSRYENGHVMPSIPSLIEIGHAVGVPASEILARAGM